MYIMLYNQHFEWDLGVYKAPSFLYLFHLAILLSFFLSLRSQFLSLNSLGEKEKMSRPGDWNCRSCQHLNFQRRDMCQRCGDPKSSGSGGGGRGSSGFGYGGSDVRPGDWYCSVGNCGAHNFASRSSCFKCGAFKDEMSAFDFDIPRPSPRGISPFAFASPARTAASAWKSGDWICARSGCNEHNFASRMECFRCSAPRDSY